ncbi:hypothetical protein [Sphingomonas sp. IW22]|jgi:TPR repeat protein|uniref:hypothetical protein n=1 Tax=Sphingomonas sp. IW22 TaxID=3242489 RepID=UPI003521B007
MGSSLKNAHFLIENRMRDAARGDADALYDLGMVYASGAQGAAINLIEAHKWFNLAAMSGSVAAQACRAEIAGDMSASEIAAAQRAARAWIQSGQPRAH